MLKLSQLLYTNIIRFIAQIKIIWLKNLFIKIIIYLYKIDLSEYESHDINYYHNLNHFFTRKLKANSRLVNPKAKNIIISPVDGKIMQAGLYKNPDQIIQAKNINYKLHNLLQIAADSEIIKQFQQGHYFNFYLAPQNYHRIHAPLDFELTAIKNIPGYLFSVNPKNFFNKPDLFTINQRLVLFGDTEFGQIILVFVAAIGVSNIELPKKFKNFNPENNKLKINKSEEIGWFNLGSTVILLTNFSLKNNFDKNNIKIKYADQIAEI